MMSILKYESAFKNAVADCERSICIDLLRQSPELTIGDLAKLAKGTLANLLARIRLGELTGHAPGIQTKTAATAKPPAAKPPRRPTPVNTRTPAGRAEYEAALLAALTDVPSYTGVSTLVEKAGGTNLQARATLNRLIEAGKVTWTGRARGTKYRLASEISQ